MLHEGSPHLFHSQSRTLWSVFCLKPKREMRIPVSQARPQPILRHAGRQHVAAVPSGTRSVATRDSEVLFSEWASPCELYERAAARKVFILIDTHSFAREPQCWTGSPHPG